MAICQEKLSKDYNKIWDSYIKKENLNDTINLRLQTRRSYYYIIQKCISIFDHPIVLELGCGTGVDINLVYHQNRNMVPCASDLLIKSIEVGNKVRHLFNNQINYFVSDTFEIPLKDNEVDIVFSQGLIEHFKDPVAVVKEQTRILRKGGFLIINVPQKFTGYTLMKKTKMRKGTWKLGWETEFSYNDLKKLGNQIGLKEVTVRGYQYWRSWKEPTFVCKDLVDKIIRKMPTNLPKLFTQVKTSYNSLWKKLEFKWGHYFLQNIIVVFKK